MIQGFAHVALYTDLFDETIQFYREIFDAEVIGMFHTDVRACWLLVGKDILEIFEGRTYCEGGFKHIAVACDNTDELFEKALQYGAAPHVYPKDITLNLKKEINARIAFIKGVNGEQIELFETR